MSPRRPTKTDAEILAASAGLMAREGKAPTLAAVAREVGLSAPRLVQRFGSRKGLLVAIARHGLAAAKAQLIELRKTDRAPLDALAELLGAQVRGHTPKVLSRRILDTFEEFGPDTELSALGRDITTTKLRLVRGYLDLAVERGDLAPTDTKLLAQLVAALAAGSVLLSVYQRGPKPAAALRRDLMALLAPYRSGESRS